MDVSILSSNMLIKRRKTKKVKVANLEIGSDFPIVIQSMCSTRTEDANATIAQILELEKEGCQMVRVAVPNFEAARNIPAIKNKTHIPLVADIHFDYRLALEAIEQGADKVRINPGNIGGEKCVAEILEAAKEREIALRLGINSGSLEQRVLKKYGRPSPQALVFSALRWINFFEKHEFGNFVISIKSSDVAETVAAYRLLAQKCDYPFHVGVTEAGLPPYGSIKSAIGIGALLLDGIGDTIRVSVSADPVEEIKVCKQILQALHLRKGPEVISCPACGRAEIDVIKLAKEVEKRLAAVDKPIKVAVMGCVVNGPGEAAEADFGIAGGRKQGAIFRRGKIVKWVSEKRLVEEFMKMIEEDL